LDIRDVPARSRTAERRGTWPHGGWWWDAGGPPAFAGSTGPVDILDNRKCPRRRQFLRQARVRPSTRAIKHAWA